MALEPSLTAFQAYGLRQQTAAHNVANLNTDGFAPSRVELQEVADFGGVKGDVVRLSEEATASRPQAGQPGEQATGADQAEEPLARAGREPSRTDLATEMTTMMENVTAYAANAAAIRTSQQMSGEVLNLLT